MAQVTALVANAFAVGVFAIISYSVPTNGICIFLILFTLFIAMTARIVSAHGYRVIIRSWATNEVSLREGSFWLWFPEYVVSDKSQFGPWSQSNRLPVVGQVVEIDVPEVLVPVNHGLYCLKVNTKLMGVVESYSAEDLVRNPLPLPTRCHDIIAHAIRSAVHDKSVEEALSEIQRMFLMDGDSISKRISLPTFRPTRLLLDADKHIAPANDATVQAMDLLVQKSLETKKRSALEASMETEELRVKLHKVSLQTSRNEFMLQQEAYGKEGAALIEAAKHSKALYLFSGSSGGGVNASTVLTLPA